MNNKFIVDCGVIKIAGQQAHILTHCCALSIGFVESLEVEGEHAGKAWPRPCHCHTSSYT
jgi:hypothetical protein